MKLNEVMQKDQIAEMLKKHNLDPKDVATKAALKAAKAIAHRCKPYLRENPDPITSALLRGMNSNELILIKNVRLEDRKPKDTGTQKHKILNDYFTQHYGQPYRNALFLTGNMTDAEIYGSSSTAGGSEYIIFPVGKYSYIWSPEVGDLYRAMWTNGIEKTLSRWGDSYIQDNLIEGIKRGNEIMMRCKLYIAVNVDIGDHHIEFIQEYIRMEK